MGIVVNSRYIVDILRGYVTLIDLPGDAQLVPGEVNKLHLYIL